MPRYTSNPLLPQIELILAAARKPLHYKEITQRLLDIHAWKTVPKSPEKSVTHVLSAELRENENSAIKRVSPGVYVYTEPVKLKRGFLQRVLSRVLGGR